MTDAPIDLERTFIDLPEDGDFNLRQADLLLLGRGTTQLTWEKLLESQRVLIVSEAGMGKTVECKVQQERLWAQGEPSFYLELSVLARAPFESQLMPEQKERFARWFAAQNERATFFLDSIDELKLTPSSFEYAIRRVAAAIGVGNLHRARIVLTTRPVPMDRHIIEKYLPAPESENVVVGEKYFVSVAMGVGKSMTKSDVPAAPIWRWVALSPLSESQMRALAVQCGVVDVDNLLAAIDAHNAHEFTERPLDFMELCGDWKRHGRIRSHREQVSGDIETKLRSRDERPERAPLALERAREGAERLAFAALMTRRFTIWYGRDADRSRGDSALEPARVLHDFNEDEIRTLLERPLFGFATYGRVRFHHRSVIEFLAAERLRRLVDRGMSVRTLSRLLFATTPVGLRVVKPTMRPVSAWLAQFNSTVRDEVLDRDPSLLLQLADPAVLRLEDRIRALTLYVERYGPGRWRGQDIPSLQIQRFATPNLAPTILALWTPAVSNPEVKETLLQLIGAGRMYTCANIAFGAATAKGSELGPRLHALRVVAELGDTRLSALLDAMVTNPKSLAPELVVSAVVHIFPRHMSVRQLICALRSLADQKKRASGYAYMLPSAIAEARLSPGELKELREGLASMVASTLSWDESRWELVTRREDLVPALLVVCRLEYEGGCASDAWVDVTTLALRVNNPEINAEGQGRALRERLASAEGGLRGRLFWSNDRLIGDYRGKAQDAARRLTRLLERPPLELEWEADADWLRSVLSDARAAPEDRLLVLGASQWLLMRADGALEQLRVLLPCVADAPAIEAELREAIKHIENPPPEPKWARDNARRQEESRKKEAKRYASWSQFWRDVVADPDGAFASSQENTAWNLWSVMGRVGGSGSGWNRGFIERAFNPAVANRLREALKNYWRTDRPTVWSERPAEARNTYRAIWTMGLAGLYAEVETTGWATLLNTSEAELAARYALLELNRLPVWLDDLIDVHPAPVESLVGAELIAELSDQSIEYSMLLQNISQSSRPVIDLILPRVRAWLKTGLAARRAAKVSTRKLEPAIRLVADYGTDVDRKGLVKQATSKLKGNPSTDDVSFWLQVLLRLDAEAALGVLENFASTIPVQARSPVTSWLAALFGDWGGGSVGLEALGHRPELVFRAARLACSHVRFADDNVHDGAYSPDERDHAEHARSMLINMLLNAKGVDAWHAKLTFANAPEVIAFRDRALAVAEQILAEEWDAPPMDEREVVELEQQHEFPPANRADLAMLLQDRLADIGDLLVRDESPREAWSKIQLEREMRREISRALQSMARSAYTLSQEAATGDERETDVRLISARGPLEAVIELKLAEQNYTVVDYEVALRDQLVTRYLAPEHRRVGCLLISIAKDRTWKHPRTGKKMSLEKLLEHLNALAATLVGSLGNDAYLTAKALDLRPRDLSSAGSSSQTTRRVTTSQSASKNDGSASSKKRRSAAAREETGENARAGKGAGGKIGKGRALGMRALSSTSKPANRRTTSGGAQAAGGRAKHSPTEPGKR
ncbi:hypothetical protein ACXU4B_02500 [Dyella soli]|uniref:ATP-binding protein n=1 Tax=Dyella soli TaxID=522319 RepID=A0A4R0YTV0_9GAMM|nr:ATP-binding protein [Dyella soli]TCI09932.1 ATP-binding protein [Dyella soli]